MGLRKPNKDILWLDEHKAMGIQLKHNSSQSPVHKQLMVYAIHKMWKEKYTRISVEHKLPDGRIDLFGVKNKKKVGIECIARGSYKRKKKLYKKHLNKLIFCIPEKKRPIKKRNFWVVPRTYFKSGIIK